MTNSEEQNAGDTVMADVQAATSDVSMRSPSEPAVPVEDSRNSDGDTSAAPQVTFTDLNIVFLQAK